MGVVSKTEIETRNLLEQIDFLVGANPNPTINDTMNQSTSSMKEKMSTIERDDRVTQTIKQSSNSIAYIGSTTEYHQIVVKQL